MGSRGKEYDIEVREGTVIQTLTVYRRGPTSSYISRVSQIGIHDPETVLPGPRGPIEPENNVDVLFVNELRLVLPGYLDAFLKNPEPLNPIPTAYTLTAPKEAYDGSHVRLPGIEDRGGGMVIYRRVIGQATDPQLHHVVWSYSPPQS